MVLKFGITNLAHHFHAWSAGGCLGWKHINQILTKLEAGKLPASFTSPFFEAFMGPNAAVAGRNPICNMRDVIKAGMGVCHVISDL